MVQTVNARYKEFDDRRRKEDALRADHDDIMELEQVLPQIKKRPK